jgi:hypothetical protein
VEESLGLTPTSSPNLSVHLTGVPLRFTQAGDFIVSLNIPGPVVGIKGDGTLQLAEN